LEQINDDQNILEPNGLTIQARFSQLSTKLVTVLSAISIKDGNSRISIYFNQFGNMNIFGRFIYFTRWNINSKN